MPVCIAGQPRVAYIRITTLTITTITILVTNIYVYTHTHTHTRQPRVAYIRITTQTITTITILVIVIVILTVIVRGIRTFSHRNTALLAHIAGDVRLFVSVEDACIDPVPLFHFARLGSRV